MCGTTKFSNLFIFAHFDLNIQAWKLWSEGNAKDFIDPSIADSCSPDEALRCIHVGLLCVQDSPNDRPVISSVVFMLENEGTISATLHQPVFTIQRNIHLDIIDQSAENFEIHSLNHMTVTMTEGH